MEYENKIGFLGKLGLTTIQNNNKKIIKKNNEIAKFNEYLKNTTDEIYTQFYHQNKIINM